MWNKIRLEKFVEKSDAVEMFSLFLCVCKLSSILEKNWHKAKLSKLSELPAFKSAEKYQLHSKYKL